MSDVEPGNRRREWTTHSATGLLSVQDSDNASFQDAQKISSAVERFPVSETSLGGRRDPSRYMYRFDNTAYSTPDFARWAGVDFDMLRREIVRSKEVFHGSRDKWPQIMSQLPGRPVYPGAVCVISLPSSWEDYYCHNALDLRHLVLNNLADIHRLEYQEYKVSCSTSQNASIDRHTIIPGLEVEKPWDLTHLIPPSTDGSGGDSWFIFLRESTLLHLVNSLEKRYKTDYLMRFDQLKLHVSPLEWDQTKSTIFQRAQTIPSTDPRHLARFSMSIEILYELAPDLVRRCQTIFNEY